MYRHAQRPPASCVSMIQSANVIKREREEKQKGRERYLEKIEKESEEEHSLMTTASVEARDVLSGAQRE